MNEGHIEIRSPEVGEYGWMLETQGQYYAEKFGWKDEFKFILKDIILDYLSAIVPFKQACYIAALNGEPIGSVMLMQHADTIGKISILFVAERARRKGVGTLLMRAVIEKAQVEGYTTLTLWTTNNQIEARKLYKKIGFYLASKGPNTTFAKGSYDEEWRMRI